MNDFRKFATSRGMSGMVLDDVVRAQAQYLNPYILEERQLNVTQMDVFSRLMMDRIIFLGTEINDYTANTLSAQLLYLDSVDPGKDISIYINSPGGSVTAGLAIYDTMQFVTSDVATMCTGMAASMAAVLLVAGKEGKRSALQPRDDTPAPWRCAGTGFGHRNRGPRDSEVQEGAVYHHFRPLAHTIRQGVGRLRPQLLDDSRGGKRVRNDRLCNDQEAGIRCCRRNDTNCRKGVGSSDAKKSM